MPLLYRVLALAIGALAVSTTIIVNADAGACIASSTNPNSARTKIGCTGKAILNAFIGDAIPANPPTAGGSGTGGGTNNGGGNPCASHSDYPLYRQDSANNNKAYCCGTVYSNDITHNLKNDCVALSSTGQQICYVDDEDPNLVACPDGYKYFNSSP